MSVYLLSTMQQHLETSPKCTIFCKPVMHVNGLFFSHGLASHPAYLGSHSSITQESCWLFSNYLSYISVKWILLHVAVYVFKWFFFFCWLEKHYNYCKAPSPQTHRLHCTYKTIRIFLSFTQCHVQISFSPYRLPCFAMLTWQDILSKCWPQLMELPQLINLSTHLIMFEQTNRLHRPTTTNLTPAAVGGGWHVTSRSNASASCWLSFIPASLLRAQYRRSRAVPWMTSSSRISAVSIISIFIWGDDEVSPVSS